ncbi:hypothetical protein [Rubripirellula obstinata]|nr:hypothetical protein [Rubripirellula obstinata]
MLVYSLSFTSTLSLTSTRYCDFHTVNARIKTRKGELESSLGEQPHVAVE